MDVLSLSSNRNDICVTWLGFASTITDEQARLLNLRVLNSVERRSGVWSVHAQIDLQEVLSAKSLLKCRMRRKSNWGYIKWSWSAVVGLESLHLPCSSCMMRWVLGALKLFCPLKQLTHNVGVFCLFYSERFMYALPVDDILNQTYNSLILRELNCILSRMPIKLVDNWNLFCYNLF